MSQDFLGLTLKTLRKKRKLTLKQLSEETGLSIGFLSQVERGKSNMTLETLRKVADVLDVNPGIFFEEEHVGTASSKPDARFHYKDLSHGVKEAALSPLLVTLHPDETDWNPFSHSGFEFLFVLEGTLTVEIDGERFLLSEQEAVLFDARKTHYWANHTDRAARFLVVSSKP